jgi:hypothetical protein
MGIPFINVDVTTCLEGFHGDTSATFLIGEVSQEARHVVDVARRCRDAGVAVVRHGAKLGDIGAAIEELARAEACSVVEEFGGHGIGRFMHQAPHVSHVGRRGTGITLRAGMAREHGQRRLPSRTQPGFHGGVAGRLAMVQQVPGAVLWRESRLGLPHGRRPRCHW